MNLHSCNVVLKTLNPTPNNFSCGGMLLTVKGREVHLSPIALKFPLSASLNLIICTCNQDFTVFKVQNQTNKQVFFADNQFLGENFNALIVYCENGKFTPCMFGKSGKNDIKMGEMLNFYAQNFKKTETYDSQKKDALEVERYNRKHSEKIQDGKSERGSTICTEEGRFYSNQKEWIKNQENILENCYNDEKIAEENYFEFVQEDITFKEIENARLLNQINDTKSNCKPERKKEENANASQQYDTSPCDNSKQTGTWYSENVKQKIEEIFNKYPPISALTDIIPQSKWAQIPYSNNKFYIVGTVSENEVVKYVVYGVPGDKNHVPKGFERYSRFIPESIFNLESNGFWCIFQSAENGMQVCPD